MWGRRQVWLNRKVLLELVQKKKICDLWNQDQASQGDYRAAVRIFREKTKKDKTQLEFTLATVVSNKKKKKKKKSLFKVCQRQKKVEKQTNKQNGLTLDENIHLTSRNEEKAEVFNIIIFLPSVFNSDYRSWAAQSSELEDHDWETSDFPFVVTKIETIVKLFACLSCTSETRTGHSTPQETSLGLSRGEGSASSTC